MNNIVCRKFCEVNLQDEFFQTLREDYQGFDDWFLKKNDEIAYVQYENDKIQGFLYLKMEDKFVDDVTPTIIANRILKVGTFKINAHGTKMGEQFVKIIMDYAIKEQADVCYVTIYEKHSSLINLVQQFGFEYHGTKGKGLHQENVYLKKMRKDTGNASKDYPYVNVNKGKKYLLSIVPKYHSILFPDSILKTENRDIITDVSHTNSIHKVYICAMAGVSQLRYGDILIIYRTDDGNTPAYYSAVATSICVVEEVRCRDEFSTFKEFYDYANKYSVFDEKDLRYWYRRSDCMVIKMTYNAAFKKRIIRKELLEQIGLNENQYWGFFRLEDNQFSQIVEMGEATEVLL